MTTTPVTSPPPATGGLPPGSHQNSHIQHHQVNNHAVPPSATTAPAAPAAQTENVGKIDRAIQLLPSELEGPLTQEETEYEAVAKKRKRLKNRKGPVFYPPCKTCVQCKNCKKRAKIKLRLEWADHFPVTKEQYQEAVKAGSPYRQEP